MLKILLIEVLTDFLQENYRPFLRLTRPKHSELCHNLPPNPSGIEVNMS
ncbi:hypothetical protein U2A404250045 [Corynebacterium striatum]|nr:hypothetical protein U2A404250045 [Corynebacterium striatum]